MYDNIKLSLRCTFDNSKRDEFCTRFGLSTVNEKTKTYHNGGGNSNLEQNKGIYLHLKGNNLTIRLSLHKFYNYYLFKKSINYGDFDFKNANQAAKWICEMFIPYFDIMQSEVKKYEVGINIFTSGDPDLYLKELKQMNIHARIIPIKEDIHYKEYKQYSTQRDKDKRVIYIFYNKTFEARSKAKEADREKIPENILRVEKDNKRIAEKILFERLFNVDFQWLTLNEFKQRFCNDLQFKGIPIKPEEMSKTDYDILCLIFEKGMKDVRTQMENDYKNGKIKRRTYFNRLRTISETNDILPKIKVHNSQRANEIKILIANKLKEIQCGVQNFAPF
jgi:hypothetical protein